MIFAAVNLSAWRLRRQIDIRPWVPLSGLVLSLAAWLALGFYLWAHDGETLLWLGLFYGVVIVIELLFSQRRRILKTGSPQ